MQYNSLSGLSLAYLGDAVLEVQTRKKLLEKGITDLKKLNREALNYVRAVEQSAAMERLLPHLSEEETDVFKRGRNSHGVSAPRSATVVEYRRATGMEALFGWLYLAQEHTRIEELFALAFPDEEEDK